MLDQHSKPADTAKSAASDRGAPHRDERRAPFACVALLLQGGGALGAYQAGVYQALDEADLVPDWYAGISIGAVNAALIAGNPKEKRVERLRAFWETITNPFPPDLGAFGPLLENEATRGALLDISAAASLLRGQPGFFTPRIPPPWFTLPGAPGPTSFYDTAALRATLERFVDFDRINARETRFSVAAVNVKSGNFVYFDNARHRIGPEHIIASGSLPPGFPPTEVDGELYWDGGLISNTPLQWLLDNAIACDTLAFQVDLWSARGRPPRNLAEVAVRQKEIQYSSRTRMITDVVKSTQKFRCAVARLLAKLPPELRDDPEVAELRPLISAERLNIVHIIYRAKSYENQAKDYEFSRLSMREHWRAGYEDAMRSLADPAIFVPADRRLGVKTFDFGAG
jgi:NTE family protein